MKLRSIRFGILSQKMVWGPKIVRTFYTTAFELKEGIKFLFGEKATFATQFESHTILWIIIIEICGSKAKGGKKFNNKLGNGDERSESKVKHTNLNEQGLNNFKEPQRIKANF